VVREFRPLAGTLGKLGPRPPYIKEGVPVQPCRMTMRVREGSGVGGPLIKAPVLVACSGRLSESDGAGER
jgi:hypothetical protein